MLNEKHKSFSLNSSLIFKGIIVLGLSIVLISGLSLYKQTYHLDVIEFDKAEVIVNSKLLRLSPNSINTFSLDDETERKTNSGFILLEEVEYTSYQLATLLSVVYETKPFLNENFGTMTIPRLNRVLPILQGTNEKQLAQGIGHVENSVLPGENDNLVLAGHRETSFRKLNQLIIGDFILIETELGEFTYEVDQTRIVDEDDTSVIISTGYASLSLVTCYPFDWVGSAPQRYIVNAILVKSILN